MIARCNLCVPVEPPPGTDDDGVFKVPWDLHGAAIMQQHIKQVHGVDSVLGKRQETTDDHGQDRRQAVRRSKR